MIVTHEVNMDLVQRGPAPRISVVQDDRYSRNLVIRLYSCGAAWEPGEGTEAVIRYMKSDSRGGSYNILPDGSPAYQISGNTLTVALAPQVCTAVGPVELGVCLINGAAELHTFSVKLDVQPVTGVTVNSQDYYRLSGTVPNSGWDANLYLGTDENGNVVTRDNSECVKSVNGLTPDDTGDVALPDDALHPPATARVGDYLRVTAVNGDGRITELEAVPEGAAGAGGMEIIFLKTVPELSIDDPQGVFLLSDGDVSMLDAAVAKGKPFAISFLAVDGDSNFRFIIGLDFFCNTAENGRWRLWGQIMEYGVSIVGSLMNITALHGAETA